MDAGSTREGWPYFALEYVEGEHIVDFARSGVLSLSARLDLFEQLCGAVSYAHEQQIVHCDLKPTNVLVSKTGRVKVLDFGIAKVLRPRIRAGKAQNDSFLFSDQPCEGAHTPIYSPPEVRSADRTLGPEADVYSLGLLGRVLLQGAYPASERSTRFAPVWNRAMADVPAVRHRTASELLSDLRDARTRASGSQLPNSQLPGASGSSLR